MNNVAPGDNCTNGDQAEKFIYMSDAWLTSDFNNDGNLNSIKTLTPVL